MFQDADEQVDDGQNTPDDLKRAFHPPQPDPAGRGHAASSSLAEK
jgi:hypothetical protein